MCKKGGWAASLQHSSVASTLGFFLATVLITSVETLSKTGTKWKVLCLTTLRLYFLHVFRCSHFIYVTWLTHYYLKPEEIQQAKFCSQDPNTLAPRPVAYRSHSLRPHRLPSCFKSSAHMLHHKYHLGTRKRWVGGPLTAVFHQRCSLKGYKGSCPA